MTEHTCWRLRDRYLFEERGSVEVKGKGVMQTYLLVGRQERAADGAEVRSTAPG